MLFEAYQKKKVDMNQCTGCEMCVQICPTKAITMKEDDEGFFYPEVNNDMCAHCGQCAIQCPVLEPIPKNNMDCVHLYSGYEKTLQYQKRCSSGGIFGLLADKVLQAGGVVFGAAFDSRTKSVVHVSSDEIALDDILRSKYVQSHMGTVYKKIKEMLDGTNRKVLFCGTPCQVEGLLRFLKKDYENLITVDFVCHGVPSPGIFREVLISEEKIHGGVIKNVTFREKNPKGRGEEYLYLYLYDDRKIEYKSLDYYYYYLFLYNCILRKSCMNCSRAENHKADLTLADDWLQEWQKDPAIGVSLIRVNTEKGKKIFATLHDELLIHSVDLEKRKIIVQAHCYSNKDRERTLRNYKKTKDIRFLKKNYQRLRFRNESKKKAIYIISKCYRKIVPRRKCNDGN